MITIFFLITIEGKTQTTDKFVKRINHFLKITNVEKEYKDALQTHIKNDATLKHYENETMLFFNKFFTYKSIHPQIVQLYSEFYTLSDINGLIKFYSTPLGKKHAALESKLEKRFDELLEEKLNSMIPQMTTWFKENLNINIPEHDTNQTADSDDDNDDN